MNWKCCRKQTYDEKNITMMCLRHSYSEPASTTNIKAVSFWPIYIFDTREYHGSVGLVFYTELKVPKELLKP